MLLLLVTENRASWTNRDVNGSEWEYLGAPKTNCAALWLSVQGTDVAEAAWAVLWISALQPHLGTKSHVEWEEGRETIQHWSTTSKTKRIFLGGCLIKADCSYLSYKCITARNDPTVTLICHNFKTNAVVLFFHCNLFWLPALSICSYYTNIHSTGVHNSLSLN